MSVDKDADLVVRSCKVIVLQLFDLAYEIDFKAAEGLWKGRAVSTRSRLAGMPVKAVSFGVPPLELEIAILVPIMFEIVLSLVRH